MYRASATRSSPGAPNPCRRTTVTGPSPITRVVSPASSSVSNFMPDRRSKRAGVYVLQELDHAGHVRLLIVVDVEVAAVCAQQEPSVLDVVRHLLHRRWIHRVVRGSDDERRHGD